MASVDPFALVEQGLEVFPLQVVNPGTDRKELVFLTPHWNNDASSDPAKVSEWISRFGERITDWGIPTGHRSGFAVVDIDSDEASDWWLSQWLPDGRQVETPRGGAHIFYCLDGVDADIKTCQNQPYQGIDIRGEGGFVVAYTEDYSDIPDMPASVLEILPEKQAYSSEPVPEGIQAPAEVSPQEERVLKGLTDILDRLPQKWHKGAGYHDAAILVSCGLNRIANSPYYSTTRDQARALYVKHMPLRDSADAAVRDKRWQDAVKMTADQWFEAPSDVPVRLDANECLDRFPGSATERLFWESRTIGDVKDLIRELRNSGATDQEAYSISYECAAMKKLRKKNPEHSSSTWGYVKAIYEPSEAEDVVKEVPAAKESGEWSLLTAEERDIVRNYPNFIDRYILSAKEILSEPNMPLHYVNAWIALSSILGDRADIVLKKGRVPLSLWGMPLAGSAGGKGDAKAVMIDNIDACRRGGFGDVNAGGNASAEGLTDFVSEREGRVTFFNKDESSALLEGMHKENSYESKMMTLSLDLYDGKANQNLRVGNAKDGLGSSVKTTFNMWLQTTWKGATGALTSGDIESGLIGRFLVAIGDDAKITDESLRMEMADEYQVSLGGVHPSIKSIGDGLNAVVGRVRGITMSAGKGVLDRHVESRKKVLKLVSKHPQAEQLRGVMLRVTENMLKAAALLAVSEGRSRIDMPDLLLALKSGQYWVRDAIRLCEAISTSEYRKRVDEVIRYCTVAPRTRGAILTHASFKNLTAREVAEAIERAEAEGAIKRSVDGKKWVSNIE